MRNGEPFGGWSLRQVQVNGQPGALVLDAADRLIAVAVLDIADDHVQAVPWIVTRTTAASGSDDQMTARRPTSRCHRPAAVTGAEGS